MRFSAVLVTLAVAAMACGGRATTEEPSGPGDSLARPSPTAAPTSSASPTAAGERLLVLRSIRTFEDRNNQRTVRWPDVGELWSARLGGSPPKLVKRFEETYDGRVESHNEIERQLSPDGSQLVLSAYSARGHLGLIVVDTSTGSTRTLTDDPRYDDVMPAWSPDGTRIAFARRHRGESALPGLDAGLWLIAPDARGLKQVVRPALHAQLTVVFDWTPDSRMIGYGSAFESVSHALLDVDTGASTSFKGAFFGSPSWRAARPQFLGIFGEGGYAIDVRLEVADGPGASQRPLLRSTMTCANDQAVVRVGGVEWRPGSDEFLYRRWEGTCGAGQDAPPTVPQRSGLFVADLSGAIGRRLPTTDVPSVGTWTPDGRWVVYALTRQLQSGPQSVRVIGADGAGDRALFTLAGMGGPGWIRFDIAVVAP